MSDAKRTRWKTQMRRKGRFVKPPLLSDGVRGFLLGITTILLGEIIGVVFGQPAIEGAKVAVGYVMSMVGL